MDAPPPDWAKAVSALNAYLAFWEIIAQPHMPAARPVRRRGLILPFGLAETTQEFKLSQGLFRVAGLARQLFSAG
jgi:hypothetical protein